jgi:hypothetical protein
MDACGQQQAEIFDVGPQKKSKLNNPMGCHSAKGSHILSEDFTKTWYLYLQLAY